MLTLIILSIGCLCPQGPMGCLLPFHFEFVRLIVRMKELVKHKIISGVVLHRLQHSEVQGEPFYPCLWDLLCASKAF